MKKLKILIGTLILAAGLAGCSSAYYASSGYANDDLYSLHDKTAIARKQQAKAEAEKAAAEARRAEWEARIAEAQAAAAENQYYEYNSNPYEDIVADTYESAYARRLRGFESPTYRMPSSYYNFRYGGSFTYATAYDPAFYNIIISGDQVWVEPKYITSMFGTWGGSVYVLRLDTSLLGCVGPVVLVRQLGLELRLQRLVQSLVRPVVGAGLGARMARRTPLGIQAA